MDLRAAMVVQETQHADMVVVTTYKRPTTEYMRCDQVNNQQNAISNELEHAGLFIFSSFLLSYKEER
jgi:hypothetical protein